MPSVLALPKFTFLRLGMFLVGYLVVEVVSNCFGVWSTLHAFWHWGVNISRGGGEGTERSEIE